MRSHYVPYSLLVLLVWLYHPVLLRVHAHDNKVLPNSLVQDRARKITKQG